jgi:hypothetical protein
MPGQSLNVLEVPFDVERFGSHSRSASMISLLNIVKTLNPADRYVNPQPAPKPEVKASAEGTVKALHVLRSKVGTPFPTNSTFPLHFIC